MTSETTPRREVDPRLTSRMRLYVVLLFAVVVCLQLELPFRLAGIGFGAATIWVGALVLAQLSRQARRGVRPRGQLAVSLGIGLTGVMLSLLLRDAAFYPLVSEHESCLAGAQTKTAREACDEDAVERTEDFIERLTLRRN